MSECEEQAAEPAQPVVVAFPEHVGGSDARQIGEELLAAFADGAAVVIADMSATVSCDGVLTWACQVTAVRQAELRLVATASAARRLLAGQDLDRLVAVYSSVAAAVAAGRLDEAGPIGDPGPPTAAPQRPDRALAVSGDGQGVRMLTRAMLWQLIDALADGIILADEDGQIVLANRQAAVMFGYRPGELAGQPVESLVPTGISSWPWPGTPCSSSGRMTSPAWSAACCPTKRSMRRTCWTR